MKRLLSTLDSWTAPFMAPFSREALQDGIDIDSMDPEMVESYGSLGLQLMCAGIMLKTLLIIFPG